MGYVPSSLLVKSVDKLIYKYDETGDERHPLRTQGFWHVLIALRYLRLNNTSVTRTFDLSQSYDLAEACFDINGIYLPIEMASREVYFEPAASSGKGPSEYFRHREGPRQTYANRIYTGLGGSGPRQPKLFDLSGSTLPVTVTLDKDWVKSLRDNHAHKYILDAIPTEFIAFIFRFGVPFVNGKTSSIAKHNGQGSLTTNIGLLFDPIPNDLASLKEVIKDFFGLTDAEFSDMLLHPALN